MKKQKGFVWLPFLLVILGVLVVGGGVYYAAKQNTATQAPQVQTEQAITPQVQATENSPVKSSATAPTNITKPLATMTLELQPVPGSTVNTAPITMTVGGTYLLASCTNPNDPNSYVVYFGDGTTENLSFSGIGHAVESSSCYALWKGANHTYASPGIYQAGLLKNPCEGSSCPSGSSATIDTATITLTGAVQPSSSMSQYTDGNFGFSFWYPSSWMISQLPLNTSAPFGTTIKRLKISGGTQQNNIEIDEVHVNGTALTLAHAGCTATYSFSGQWMEADSGCDGATNIPAPFKGSYTMGGLPAFLDQNGLSTQSWVVPVSDTSLQNILLITPLGSYTNLAPTLNTIVATDASVAMPVSATQQTAAIQAEQSAYVGL